MITAQDINKVPYTPTPENIRAQLERLKINQVEAAHLLRVDERTMRRYLQEPGSPGSTTMPFGSFALLRLTKRSPK